MIALVALSARRLAGWATADGMPAAVFDAFGDDDTRALATRWIDVGDPGTPRIDADRLADRFGRLVADGTVDGWVLGSGLEGRLSWVERLASAAPLHGTPVATLRRLEDPPAFFATLDALGIAHPPVRFTPPADAGWLRKRADSTGGWGVDRRREPGPGAYWQRERTGPALSATYVANGERAVLLGLNRQQVTEIGGHPFVFCGVVGPVAVAAPVRTEVERALDRLVPAFGLMGLGSIDFVLGPDGRPECLEVNARPSASAALYPLLDGASPLAAHLRACRTGALPAAPVGSAVRGLRIVYTRRPLRLDADGAARIASTPGAGDLPRAGAAFAAGAPLCTLDAEAPDADDVEATLSERANDLLNRLETA